MGRRRRAKQDEALVEVGYALERHLTSCQADIVTAVPEWGSTLSVPGLLDVFLTEGRKDLGIGTLVVPDNLRPRTVERKGFSRIEIVTGRPYFEGRRLLKVLELITGSPRLTHIDLAHDWSGGVIALSGMFDWPFTIDWR